MRRINSRFGILSLAAAALLFAGCLVSGTFVVTIFIEDWDFSPDTNLYHYEVDLTEDSDWEDHQDDIKNIDVIGMEVWLTNLGDAATTFNVWVDDIGEPVYTSVANVADNATVVLEDIGVDPGANHLSYAGSLSVIQNVSTLKALAKSGRFHWYGHSTLGADFVLDSARIVVTVSAGGT